MAQSDGVKETIDGVEYTVYMLDPTLALRLLRRILAVVSPAIGALAGAADKTSVAERVTPELFSRIAAELFDRFDEKLLDDLVQKLGEVSMASGKRVSDVASIHFRGRIGHMLKWLAFALRVQYADFFDGLKPGIARVVAEMTRAPASASPSTSQGTG